MKDIIFKTNSKYSPLAVSHCGKVKNLETGVVLRQPIGSHGYPIVSGFVEGKRRCLCVHRMVGEILIPNPHNHPVINHLDSDRTNNNTENLEWTTYKGNAIHARDADRLIFNPNTGEDSNLSLHSDVMIHEICKCLSEGMRNIDASKQFNIPTSYIKEIRSQKTRKDITEQYNFPKFKRQSISSETVHWVCTLLAANKTSKEIISLSDNPKITTNLIKNIRRKSSYKTISDLYF